MEIDIEKETAAKAELLLALEVAKIFKCDIGYAHKIMASFKMNLPIQGATPEQMYLGYLAVLKK